MGSLNGVDGGHPRDALLQVALDPGLQRHDAGGTTNARPMKSHLNHSGIRDIHQFNVATVRLNGRPDQVKDFRDLLAIGVGRKIQGNGCTGVGHALGLL